jgi:hypothetical protein
MCVVEDLIGQDPDDERVGQSSEDKVRLLPDHELLDFYDRLHHPSLNENKWIPRLEAEIKLRGLRGLS